MSSEAIKREDIKLEIWNSVTHGFGVILGIVFLVILMIMNVRGHNKLGVIGFAVYGVCFIFIFLMSTLYHAVQNPKAKRVLRLFDHISIYYFIAGSFTPIILLTLEGKSRIIFLIVMWTIALLGTIYKIMSFNSFDKYKMLSTLIYIGMGWMAVFLIRPMLQKFPTSVMIWILIGGIIYTVGTFFYKSKKLTYNHVIWHFFVLAAAISHFIGFVQI